MSDFVFYNYRNLFAIQKEVKKADILQKHSKELFDMGFSEKARLYQRFAIAHLYFSPVQGVAELFLLTWKEQGKDINELEGKVW